MEELRKSVSNWNLDCDDRLLRGLQSFSNKIIERSQQLEDELETLGEQTRSSQLNLANTFNKFLMLSSGQFIESRVVRDNVAEKKPEEKKDPLPSSKTQEVKATDIIERYKQSLTIGMKAMDYTTPQSNLITVFKNQHDLIEAGVAPNLPLCSKDIYNSQPLPYIIGTREFQEHGDIGLYGSFGDIVFYGMDEKEEETEQEIKKSANEDGDITEEEDFDFSWSRNYLALITKLNNYVNLNLNF